MDAERRWGGEKKGESGGGFSADAIERELGEIEEGKEKFVTERGDGFGSA